MTELYDDAAIIALIPGSLVERAKSWFSSRSMPRRKMRTVEGWIECLTDEFQINTAVAKEQASKRKYTPKDKSVMDYFYAKTELCRLVDRKIESRDLIDEIWNGLLPDFRLTMNHHEIRDMNMTDFSHLLRNKDINFRESWKQKNRELLRCNERDSRDKRPPSTPRSLAKSSRSSRS